MKLRNKKTGETIDIKDALRDSDDYPNHYLINGDWEDAPEEPKGIIKVEKSIIPTCVHIEFGTEEEAEAAVEKLKAWQRLKDKGFSFLCWNDDYTIDFTINEQSMDNRINEYTEDLNLVFGGKE